MKSFMFSISKLMAFYFQNEKKLVKHVYITVLIKFIHKDHFQLDVVSIESRRKNGKFGLHEKLFYVVENLKMFYLVYQ